MTMRIFMDQGAGGAIEGEVLRAMEPHIFGGASGSAAAVDEAREEVAALLCAEACEIRFTASGSEANSLALIGTAMASGRVGQIIISAAEHSSVRESAAWLASRGHRVTVLPLDERGMVRPADLERAIAPDALVASITYASGEVGTIQRIDELGEICRSRGVPLHTDAVQACGQLEIDMRRSPVDMMSIAAHKMRGPSGVGALFVRDGLKLAPIVCGDPDRAPLEIGMGRAAALASRSLRLGLPARTAILRDELLRRLETIPDAFITGHRTERLPNHASICAPRVDGWDVVRRLDRAGLEISAGTACSSGSLSPSPTLVAMGIDPTIARGALRFTIPHDTTPDDISRAADLTAEAVAALRALAPLT